MVFTFLNTFFKWYNSFILKCHCNIQNYIICNDLNFDEFSDVTHNIWKKVDSHFLSSSFLWILIHIQIHTTTTFVKDKEMIHLPHAIPLIVASSSLLDLLELLLKNMWTAQTGDAPLVGCPPTEWKVTGLLPVRAHAWFTQPPSPLPSDSYESVFCIYEFKGLK